MAMAAGSLGLVFAAVLLVSSWTSYRTPWVALAGWLLSTVVLLAAVAVGTTVQRPGGRWLCGFVIALYVVDLVVPALLPPAERGGPAAWNWGSTAIVLLGLAAFWRPGWIVAAAVGHASIGIGTLAVAARSTSIDAVTYVLLVTGCLIPVLAATQYLKLYERVLSIRHEMSVTRSVAESRLLTEAAVQRDIDDRLARLRCDVVPLLEAVAGSAELPLDEEMSLHARVLGDRLRHELTPTWLLRSYSGESSAEFAGAVACLNEGQLSAVAALLSQLNKYGPWKSLRVVVAKAEPPKIVVMAQGLAAVDAAAALPVQIAADAVGLQMRAATEDILLMEAL